MPTTHGCASAEEDKQCSRWTTGDHKQDYNVVGDTINTLTVKNDTMLQVGGRAHKCKYRSVSLMQWLLCAAQAACMQQKLKMRCLKWAARPENVFM
eukprot:scaffold51041_cov36-Tisochrysis_lutea.AAC.2